MYLDYGQPKKTTMGVWLDPYNGSELLSQIHFFSPARKNVRVSKREEMRGFSLNCSETIKEWCL